MPFRFRGRLRYEHRGLARWLGRIALGAGVGPPLLALLGALFPYSRDFGAILMVTWLIGWFLVAPLAFVASWLTGRTWTGGVRDIEVSAAGVSTVGTTTQRIWGRNDIESAMVLEGFGFAALEIVPRHGACVIIEAAHDEDAPKALEAMELGIQHQRVRIAFGARPVVALLAAFASTVAVGIILVVVLLFASAPTALAWFCALLAVVTPLVVYRIVSGGYVIVGSDGVRVHQPFRSSFIPVNAIANIVPRDGMHIIKTDGTDVRLGKIESRHVIPFIDRVERLLRAGHAGVALLDRGSRSVAEWRAALAIVSTAGSYRSASIGVDALIEVAQNPGPLDRRLAAAIALSNADEATRTKVRVAASSLAGHRARIAMEKAVDGELDDELLERALDEAGA